MSPEGESLLAAVSYCSSKSKYFLDIGDLANAEKELTGAHVIQVALYFKRYINDQITLRKDENNEE